MKWLATFLCLLTIPVLAESQEMQVFPQGLPCTVPSENYKEVFEQQNGELPMVTGTADLTSLRSGQNVPARMEMFVNPETRSWSIIVFFDDAGLACVLTAGKDLQAIVPGDKI